MGVWIELFGKMRKKYILFLKKEAQINCACILKTTFALIIFY
jgi:hypothetical protein